jgi:hypothetical protein
MGEGDITYEPIDINGKYDPVTCAEYAHRMNLLGTPGWKRFRHIYKNQKKVERMVNQAKLNSYRREPFWKFGVIVPLTHNQAVEIDQANCNRLRQESEATEMKQLADYKNFIDKCKELVTKRFSATWYMTSSMMDVKKADLLLGTSH